MVLDLNKSTSSKKIASNKKDNSSSDALESNLIKIKQIKKECELKVQDLSFEKSLEALDSILNSLKNDDVTLDQIQKNYIQGNIYLKHCKRLLDTVEQEVNQIDPQKLLSEDDDF